MLSRIEQIKPYKDLSRFETNEFFSLVELEKLPWDKKDLILEHKIDGLRIEVIKDGDEVKFFSYWGNEIQLPDGFRDAVLESVSSNKVVLDGELYHPKGGNKLVYDIVKHNKDRRNELNIKIFDILHLDGENLTDLPLRKRKEYLSQTLEGNGNISEVISFIRPPDFFSWDCPGEGLVVKDLDSKYNEDGSKNWWKYVRPDYFTPHDTRSMAEMEDTELHQLNVIARRFARKIMEGKQVEGWDESNITSLCLDIMEEKEKRNMPFKKDIILFKELDKKELIKFSHIKSTGLLQDRSKNSLLGLHARAKQIWQALVKRKGYHPYRIASVIDAMWWIKQEMVKRGMVPRWDDQIDWYAFKFKGKLMDKLKKKGIEDTEDKTDEELKKIKLNVKDPKRIELKNKSYLPVFPGTESERGSRISLNNFLSYVKDVPIIEKYMKIKSSGYVMLDRSAGKKVNDITAWRIQRGFKELDKITPSEFAQRWKPVKLRRPFVQLVGSLANWMDTDGDIDLIVHASEEEPIFEKTKQVLKKVFKNYEDRLHILSDQTWCGPFTNFVNLYDLSVDINGNLVLQSKRTFYRNYMTKDPSFPKDAVTSKKQKSIKPFRPFYQLKPTHGRGKKERYNIDSLVNIVNKEWEKWKDKGVIVQRKYDGITCQVHKVGDKVKIWTEDGSDVTGNLPTLVKEIESKKGKWVLIGELELYIKGEHQPRADNAAVVNHKNEKLEDKVRLTAYDILYLGDKDIHKLPAEERLKLLKSIHTSKRFKIASDTKVRNEDSLRRAVKSYSGKEGSEGAMLKLADSIYELDKKSQKQIKYKKELYLVGKVIKVHKVSGTSGTYYYDMAISGVPYVGRTYNTSVKAERGDKLKVVFVDISEYKDPKTGQTWFNWWAPRVVEKTSEKLSTKELAHKYVLQTTGRIEKKKIPKRGTSPKKPGQLGLVDYNIKRKDMEGSTMLTSGGFNLLINCTDKRLLRMDPDAILLKSAQAADGLSGGADPPIYATSEILDKISSFPVERIHPVKLNDELDLGPFHVRVEGKKDDIIYNISAGKDSEVLSQLAQKKYRWVFQNHYRGKSVHGDMRFEMSDGKLMGFTLANVYDGKIKEEVTTLKQAKEYDSKPNVWKMDLKTGEVESREGGKHTLRVNTKSRQPKAWLDMEGVTSPKKKEPGAPGGTKNYPGVFHIVGKGEVEHGAQKPDFHEFFIHGSWEGRVVFRFIPGLKGERRLAGWLYWKPKTQRPYILSRDAINDKEIPPSGEPWLPRKWEKRVPDKLNYWEKGLSKEDRLSRREELRKYFLDKDYLSVEEDITNFDNTRYLESKKFLLTVLTWKGQEVVRKLPVNQYFLRLGNRPFFLFEKNPVDTDILNAVEKDEYSKYFKPGTYKPESEINPNKSIPAKIEVLDKGTADVIEEKTEVIQIKFNGKKLKGKWILRRDDPKASLWEMEKSDSELERKETEFLTPHQIDKIRILTFHEPTPRPKIARILGCSKRTVWYWQQKLKMGV